MNRPWWLWEGAVVRVGDLETFGRLDGDAHKDGTWWVEYDNNKDDGEWQLPENITPIENPAVMLAPKWATKVRISASVHSTRSGLKRIEIVNMTYFEKDDPGQMLYTDIYWPECPDHLKGKTWELPNKPAPGA